MLQAQASEAQSEDQIIRQRAAKTTSGRCRQRPRRCCACRESRQASRSRSDSRARCPRPSPESAPRRSPIGASPAACNPHPKRCPRTLRAPRPGASRSQAGHTKKAVDHGAYPISNTQASGSTPGTGDALWAPFQRPAAFPRGSATPFGDRARELQNCGLQLGGAPSTRRAVSIATGPSSATPPTSSPAGTPRPTASDMTVLSDGSRRPFSTVPI